MILKRAYDLDVVPGGMPHVIRVSRNDSSSRITFFLYAGKGKLSVPEGASAFITGKVMDGEAACPIDVTGRASVVSVFLTKEMTGKAGKKPFEILLKAEEDGTTYTLVTATFILDIR